MATNRKGLNDRLAKESARPLNALIRSKEEIEQENSASKKEAANIFKAYKEAVRKTFLLDPISIEALRLFAFYNRKKLSETVTDMLIKYIPREIWAEARNNVIDIEETPSDYFENVVKMDIDTIYFNPKTKED